MKQKAVFAAFIMMFAGILAVAADQPVDPAADAAKEVEDIEKQANKMVEQLQNLQGEVLPSERPSPAAPPPAAAPGGKAAALVPAHEGAPSEGQPNVAEAFAALAGMSGNSLGPYQKKVFQLISNEKFLRTADEVWNHPKRTALVIYQVGFFFLTLVIRAWQQSKREHWFARLVIGLGCTLVSWAGMFYFLPRLILGTAFRDLVRMIFEVLFP